MPISPGSPYFKFTCRSCGWSLVVMQTSDVITGPRTCEKCGSADLSQTRAGLMSLLANTWLRR